MRQPMPPRPPAPPSKRDDEPPTKKARTEDSLLPERVFLDTHKVRTCIAVVCAVITQFIQRPLARIYFPSLAVS